ILVPRGDLEASGASDVECFAIGSDVFLAVGRYFDAAAFSHHTSSMMFQWDGAAFLPFQAGSDVFATAGCRAARHMVLDGVAHLLLLNEQGDASPLLAWSGAAFARVQAADCETRRSGLEGECSVLFRWSLGEFVALSRAELLFTDTGVGQALQTCGRNSALSRAERLFTDTGAGQALQTWSPQDVIALDAPFSPDDQGLDGVLLLFANYFTPPLTHPSAYTPLAATTVVLKAFERHISNAMRAPTAVAVSLDGAHVYVAAEHSASIAVFARDPISEGFRVEG
ncbi:hypothetical protein T484DRAFT_1818985, partial [Baffinella frigidus]